MLEASVESTILRERNLTRRVLCADDVAEMYGSVDGVVRGYAHHPLHLYFKYR